MVTVWSFDERGDASLCRQQASETFVLLDDECDAISAGERLSDSRAFFGG